MTRPTVKQRLRPQRSVSLPPGIINAAMTNKNSVIATWMPWTVVSRSWLMSLIITFMLVPAKLQMNWARASGASTRRNALDGRRAVPSSVTSHLHKPGRHLQRRPRRAVKSASSPWLRTVCGPRADRSLSAGAPRPASPDRGDSLSAARIGGPRSRVGRSPGPGDPISPRPDYIALASAGSGSGRLTQGGPSMDRYPPIAEHGLIGDLQTAALVSTDGTVDWWCCPRFDSPSVFASLLDYDRGGHFRIGPDRDDYVSRQLYFPDTAILVTRFLSPDGVGEVVDFMPVLEAEATDRHRLVRLVRVVRGTMRYRMEIQPRFDYGRKPHKMEFYDPDGAIFHSDGLTLTLHRADMPGRSVHEKGSSLERDGDGLRITKTLREGEIAGVVMESAGGPPKAVHPQELLELFNDTVRFWRGWLSRSTYNGRWKEQVARSAMALKLMTYAPSGGLVAAPTAALPEQVGGERNWDYRYTWIRDASFSVYALLGLGYTDEAAAFGGWLRDRIREQAG